MSHALVIDMARQMILTAAMISAPMLGIALIIGLAISLIQAVTQVQEQTLSFVPKLMAVAVTFIVALPWIIQVLIRYTVELFRSIPTIVS